jgi:signal transduction histidine kinase
MIEQPKTVHELNTLLQKLTSELSSALTPEEVADVIVSRGLALLGGHLALVYTLNADGKTMELLNKKGIPEESYKPFRRYELSVPGPLSEAVLTRQPIVIPTAQDYAARYPDLAPYIRRNGTQASASFPLIAHGKVNGGFIISFPYPKTFNEDERDFLLALAQQTAQALERAYLYDSEHKARLRLTFLSEASKILASSLDYHLTLESVSQLAVPQLAEWYHVDILTDELKVVREAARHLEPHKTELLYELNRRYPADLNAITGAGKVIRTSESVLISDVPEDLIRKYVQDEGHLELLQQFDTGSLIVVPLTARGRTFGAMTFATSRASGRRFTPADLEMAEELARRAAVAMDNARLYQDMQRAVERTTILQRLTAAFSQALTPNEVANVVITQGLEAVGALAAVVALLDKTRENLLMLGSHNIKDRLQQMYQKIPLSAHVIGNDVVHRGEAIWVHSMDEYSALYPEAARVSREMNSPMRAAVCLPLEAEGRIIGVLGISFDHEQRFSAEDRAMITALTQQCAQALERARLYGEAQELAAVNERQRLARDLHDAVSQTLFSATTIAQTLPILWQRNPERAAEQTRHMVTLNQAAMAEMRTLLLELRPEAIINTRLDNLLQQLGQAAQGRRQVEITLNLDSVDGLPPDVHVAFYRIAQETMNNILKHSRATQVRIDLTQTPAQLKLCIGDNGRGFDLNQPSAGIGLNSMRERAAAISAALDIQSQPGNGTEMNLIWQPTPSDVQLP